MLTVQKLQATEDELHLTKWKLTQYKKHIIPRKKTSMSSSQK